MKTDSHQRHGMTLIEVLVVIGITSTLMSLLLPAVQHAREAAQRTQCQNNLRQIGLALHQYHDAHRVLPMGSSNLGPGAWGYAASLLPYLDQRAAFQTADFDQPDCCSYVRSKQIAVPRQPEPASTAYRVLVCPSDPSGFKMLPHGMLPSAYPCGDLFPGSYLGVSGDQNSNCQGTTRGTGALFSRSSVRLAQITDGTSQTLVVGERGLPSDLGWGWLICGGTECEHYISTESGLHPGYVGPGASGSIQRFWSWHESGSNFLFADGRVKLLNYEMNTTILRRMGTRAAHDLVTEN